MKTTTNILICGCGIIGLTLARELALRGYDDITVIEKESLPGMHASGRNSGVLHAGIYYNPESFKAQLCSTGGRMMKDYCRERGLKIRETGKVIVTQSGSQLETLDLLYQRGVKNGVNVRIIDEKELREIEPNARTCEKALYSPETAVIDPVEIINRLYEDCLSTGKIRFQMNTRFLNPAGMNKAVTGRGTIEYRFLVNAGGAFSDRIARSFGIGREYRLIPFKGTYRRMVPEEGFTVNGNIYPVPNMINPFLGVHFTRSVEGEILIGPTAIPALGRENYMIFDDIGPETLSILAADACLLFRNRGFRSTAFSEPKKYFKTFFCRDAEKLVRGLERSRVMGTEKCGIRPQLIKRKTGELVSDFVIERGENSLHILNAVSPAFTASMSFTRMLIEEYIGSP